MIRGACACGAVRVAIDAASLVVVCHCRRCQKVGGPSIAWVRAVGAHVDGDTTAVDEGDHGLRRFCPRCGAAVSRLVGDDLFVAHGLLDGGDGLPPTLHVHVDEQLPWDKPFDGLGRLADGAIPDPPPRGWRPVLEGLTSASTVSLREIADDNRLAVATLQVTGPQQRFVAPNLLSLLQHAHTRREAWLRAIYADETVVGLVLVDFPTEDELGLPLAGRPFLWRFMIDEQAQGHGFGSRALALAIDAMRARGADRFYVSCVEGRGGPRPFYEAHGFRDTGARDPDGEVVLSRPL